MTSSQLECYLFLKSVSIQIGKRSDPLICHEGKITFKTEPEQQKANGRLFPFGIFHLLHARKYSRDAMFYLIGILPEYQNRGVTAIIFNEFYHTFQKRKIDMCYRTPELAENTAIVLTSDHTWYGDPARITSAARPCPR